MRLLKLLIPFTSVVGYDNHEDYSLTPTSWSCGNPHLAELTLGGPVPLSVLGFSPSKLLVFLLQPEQTTLVEGVTGTPPPPPPPQESSLALPVSTFMLSYHRHHHHHQHHHHCRHHCHTVIIFFMIIATVIITTMTSPPPPLSSLSSLSSWPLSSSLSPSASGLFFLVELSNGRSGLYFQLCPFTSEDDHG